MMDIDAFIDIMIKKLPQELIQHIICKYIFWPKNRYTIWRQKILKNIMHKQLKFVSNIIYIDNNYFMYYQDNKIIIHNYGDIEYNVSIYNNNSIMPIYNSDSSDYIDENLYVTSASSNLIVNGTEFYPIMNTNENITSINANSSNIVMYILYT